MRARFGSTINNNDEPAGLCNYIPAFLRYVSTDLRSSPNYTGVSKALKMKFHTQYYRFSHEKVPRFVSFFDIMCLSLLIMFFFAGNYTRVNVYVDVENWR